MYVAWHVWLGDVGWLIIQIFCHMIAEGTIESIQDYILKALEK